MVLPLVGGVILIGTTWYAVGKVDGKLTEIGEDAKKELVAAGYPILDSVGEGIREGLGVIGSGLGVVGSGLEELGSDLGTGLLGLGSEIAEELGDIGSDLGLGALKVIKGAGIAIIEGAEDVVDYTWDKVSPHRVETVTALTAITIYLTTAIILYKKIKSAN